MKYSAYTNTVQNDMIWAISLPFILFQLAGFYVMDRPTSKATLKNKQILKAHITHGIPKPSVNDIELFFEE